MRVLTVGLALLVPSRYAENLFADWWQAIEALGAVLLTLVWDGEDHSAGVATGASS